MSTTATVPAADIMLKTSELDVFIPELWTDSIRASFKQALKLGQFAKDYSSLFASGGDKVYIPTYQDVANAAAKSEGTPVDYAARNEVSLSITIDSHQYVSCMIDDLPVVQSSNELFSGYADSMAYKLALKLEADLESTLATTTNAILVGAAAYQGADTTKTIGKNSIASIIGQLYDNNVNPEECALILNSKLYSSLFLLDDFIHISKVGVSNFKSGVVGQLMGMDVYHCPQISSTAVVAAAAVEQTTGSDTAIANDVARGGYVVHNSALGMAFSKRPTPKAEYDMDYIAHKMVSDMIYGIDLLQDSLQRKAFVLCETGVTSF